jgi:uncharacterized protein (DUF302 family)
MEGLITIGSQFGPKETAERLEARIKAHGMRVFAGINQAAMTAKAANTRRKPRK